MSCRVNVLGTCLGTWDQLDEEPGVLSRPAGDFIFNIINNEIHWPSIVIARKFGQVSLGGCTYEWDNCHSGSKLILRIPPPIGHIRLTLDQTTLRVTEAQRFRIEMCLQCEMCQEELHTFGYIPEV